MAEGEGEEREGRGVRLADDYVDAIKTSARDAFGDSVIVRLFGSRVHDELRGGDIDLHFEVDPGRGTVSELASFEQQLFSRIEPQRVDKVFSVRGEPTNAFERIAYRDGIVL